MGESTQAPLVPPEVDLTDFQFMPLDVRRIRDSRIAATVSGEEFRSAVLLWCASWHQVPCGSLPDDDVELAQLAGFGRVVAAWREVKAGALYGWILANDGRLYHPVIAEKAIDGWNAKRLHAWKKESDRIRKENKQREEIGQPVLDLPRKPDEVKIRGGGIPSPQLPFSAGTQPLSDGGTLFSDGKAESGNGIPAESALKGQGQGQGEEREGSDDPSCPKPARPARTRSRYPGDFEAFWLAYPTDKLMSKLEAGKVWAKLTENDRASATAAIPGFVAYCRNHPDYRPVHAVRFLSQRRFEGFQPKKVETAAGSMSARPADPLIDMQTGFKRNESDLRAACRRYRENRHSWNYGELGPEPDQPRCRVPEHILVETGFREASHAAA